MADRRTLGCYQAAAGGVARWEIHKDEHSI